MCNTVVGSVAVWTAYRSPEKGPVFATTVIGEPLCVASRTPSWVAALFIVPPLFRASLNTTTHELQTHDRSRANYSEPSEVLPHIALLPIHGLLVMPAAADLR
jgi:hypothetical protein